MTACPICESPAASLGAVNFNKACSGSGAAMLEPTDLMIEYELCPNCGFCFAPEMMRWPVDKFKAMVYNSEYALVDPEYCWARPNSLAQRMIEGVEEPPARHLDYGGGNGTLARLLRAGGWDSTSYDPLVDGEDDYRTVVSLGRFDLVSAFEVFEHVPDPHELMRSLAAFTAPTGLIMFTTLLNDRHIEADKPMNWWYAGPRNGHVSLFSAKSLAMLGQIHGFDLATISEGTHAFMRHEG